MLAHTLYMSIHTQRRLSASVYVIHSPSFGQLWAKAKGTYPKCYMVRPKLKSRGWEANLLTHTARCNIKGI